MALKFIDCVNTKLLLIMLGWASWTTWGYCGSWLHYEYQRHKEYSLITSQWDKDKTILVLFDKWASNKSIWPKQKIQIQSKILMNYADHANIDATSNVTWDKIPFLIQILHQTHSNKDHPPESDVPGLQYEWQTLFHLLNAWFVLTHLSNKLIKYSQKSLTILHFNRKYLNKY